MISRDLPLSKRDYENSATYKKYNRLVGSLVEFSYYSLLKNEYGSELYFVKSVIPAKFYRSRYSYNLIAVGEHANKEENCSKFHDKLEKMKIREERAAKDVILNRACGWKIIIKS